MTMAGSDMSWRSIAADGQAHQHNGNVNGNVVNNYNYAYTALRQLHDDSLRAGQRNEVFLKAASEGQTQRVRHFLQLGVDLDYRDDLGFTALHHAALSGYEDVVELCLQAGADVNALSPHFGSPLHLACVKGRTLVVDLLLKNRADVRAESRLMGTPLHCAVYAARVPIIEALCKRGASRSVKALLSLDTMGWIKNKGSLCAPLFAKSLDSNTKSTVWIFDSSSLDLAYCRCPEEVTKALLQGEFPVDSRSRFWCVSNLHDIGLHCAQEDSLTTDIRPAMLAARGDNFTVLQYLDNYQWDVNSQDSDGWTALHHAAERDASESINLLIQMGAVSDCADRSGYTPLMVAAEEGRFIALRALLDNFAELGACSSEKHTALHLAANEGCVRLLMQAGASPTFVDCEGLPPAFYYIKNNRPDLLQALLDVDGPNTLATTGPGGDSLVHFAAQQDDRLASLRVLIDHKALLTGWNLYELTPIGMAALYEAIECVKSLLSAGCAVDEYMGRGHSLLYLACRSGNCTIARLLLENGAPPNSFTAPDGSVPETVYDDAMSTLIREFGGVIVETRRSDETPEVALEAGSDMHMPCADQASDTQQEAELIDNTEQATGPPQMHRSETFTETLPSEVDSDGTTPAAAEHGASATPTTENRPLSTRGRRKGRNTRPRQQQQEVLVAETRKAPKSSAWAAFFAGGRAKGASDHTAASTRHASRRSAP